MSIRTTLLVLLLVVPAAALLAFGPRGLRETASDRVVIRYWEKWAGIEAAAIRRIVDQFNATVGAERGIWVDLHAVSNVDERMLIATAGGDPPDIAGLYDRYVSQFAAQGTLTDLTTLARDAHIRLDDIEAIWLDVGTFEGRLFALPCAPYTIVLYYNRALFRAAGLDPDHPPQTIAEFDECMRRLTKRGPDGDIVQLGFTAWPGMLGWWAWAWPCFFDARLWDGRRYQTDTAEVRAAMRWLAQQRAEFGVGALLKFETASLPIEGADNPFLSGKLAMVLQGPWMSNWISKYKPELDYGVARFPSVTAERQNVLASADVLVIPRGAPHPREAMVFLEYLMRPEVHELLALAHGKLSPYKEPSGEFYARHPNPHIRTFAALARLPHTFGHPQAPMFAEIWTESVFMLENVLRGLQTPEAATAATQARADQIVRQYWEMAERRAAVGGRVHE